MLAKDLSLEGGIVRASSSERKLCEFGRLILEAAHPRAIGNLKKIVEHIGVWGMLAFELPLLIDDATPPPIRGAVREGTLVRCR